MEPERRVSLVARAQQRDPLVDRREAGSANRVRRQRPPVDVRARDEQVRERAGGAQARELRPEVALRDRRVEVEDALALDERAGADGVVAGRQARRLDDRAELR
jgi:hypothetical protein